jgi:hypothetical protein
MTASQRDHGSHRWLSTSSKVARMDRQSRLHELLNRWAGICMRIWLSLSGTLVTLPRLRRVC